MSDRDLSPARLWRKIYWRVIPVVSIAWLCSYIDRGSLGYVAIPLSGDLGLSATDIGLAAGIVFVGYIVVPIPGNLIEYRIGARAWITGILVAWSLVTAATAAVDSAATLYLARILLGFAEGGFPARPRRARARAGGLAVGLPHRGNPEPARRRAGLVHPGQQAAGRVLAHPS
jgi:ACS family tartrate transporter-like MFS transporter